MSKIVKYVFSMRFSLVDILGMCFLYKGFSTWKPPYFIVALILLLVASLGGHHEKRRD